MFSALFHPADSIQEALCGLEGAAAFSARYAEALEAVGALEASGATMDDGYERLCAAAADKQIGDADLGADGGQGADTHKARTVASLLAEQPGLATLMFGLCSRPEMTMLMQDAMDKAMARPAVEPVEVDRTDPEKYFCFFCRVRLIRRHHERKALACPMRAFCAGLANRMTWQEEDDGDDDVRPKRRRRQSPAAAAAVPDAVVAPAAKEAQTVVPSQIIAALRDLFDASERVRRTVASDETHTFRFAGPPH